MQKVTRFFSVLALFCVVFSAAAMPALARSGGSGGGGTGGSNAPGVGGVVLKGPSATHGGASQGSGRVTPIGGYYTAPAVACTVSITSLDLPDGTQVQVTLEYLDPTLPIVYVGTITLSKGTGSLSTVGNPTAVTVSGFSTMSIRRLDGTVVMSGSIRRL